MDRIPEHNAEQDAVPEWVAYAPKSLVAMVSRISDHRKWLAPIAEESFAYSVVLQKAINDQSDQWIADGTIGRETKDSPMGPSRSLNRTPQVTREFARTLIYNIARPVTTLRTQVQVAERAIHRLLRGADNALKHSDFVVAFICYRGCIEQVAHMAILERDLAKLQPESRYPAAQRFVGAAYEVLCRKLYATRVNWQLFADPKVFEQSILEEEISYAAHEDRVDATAKSCLAGIDYLNKRLKGTRACYEVLCEFTHPNVGTLAAFTGSTRFRVDSGCVPWIDKTLDEKGPFALLQEFGFVVERLCEAVALSLDELRGRVLPDLIRFEGILQPAIQALCRQTIKNNPALVERYDTCPCLSGNKTRFCCGKR